MNGILVLNKEINYTSRDIVNIISKELKTKKVGHTGTLDPMASGVLVLTIGRYTKLGEMLTSLEKEYIAEMQLGIMTDTLDVTGKIIEKQNNYHVTAQDILEVFHSMIGTYHMEVPIYSAIKLNGKKLYQYARNNIPVELPKKDVEIYELELLDFHDDIIKFRAKVEKGTYIRSLIRDIAKNLNTVGTMTNLIRTKQGSFKLEDAFSLEDFKKGNYKLLNVREAVDIKEYTLNEEEYYKVKNGNKIMIDCNEKYLLLLYHNEEVAIYQKDDMDYKSYVMLKIE